MSNYAPNLAWSCPGYLARVMPRILRVEGMETIAGLNGASLVGRTMVVNEERPRSAERDTRTFRKSDSFAGTHPLRHEICFVVAAHHLDC